MERTRIKQIDAFTSFPFQGNPAGVVMAAGQLTDKEMQNIALEMNASETAFIKPTTEEEWGDIHLRWFTPTQEVDLCGHATIAAFYALAEEGKYGISPDTPEAFGIQTRVGQLSVEINWRELRPYIHFDLPLPKFTRIDNREFDCTAPFNKPDLIPDDRASLVKDQNGYLYMLLSSKEQLEELEPHTGQFKELYLRHNINAIAAVALNDSPSGESNDHHEWYSRFFAPQLGVTEDPVTGSANGPIAIWLMEAGLISKETVRSKQGNPSGRKGYVDVLTEWDEQKLKRLTIAGTACTVLDGTIVLG